MHSAVSSLSTKDGGPVDVDKIKTAQETRTTLMVKNVPCRYQHNEIRNDFEVNHKGRFNHLKVPMDKKDHEKTGKGYCFVNFRHVLFVLAFIRDKHNYHWPKYASDKTIEIHFAKDQLVKQSDLNQFSVDYAMTEAEREDLLRIMDENHVELDLKEFPPMQPPTLNKKSSKMTLASRNIDA